MARPSALRWNPFARLEAVRLGDAVASAQAWAAARRMLVAQAEPNPSSAVLVAPWLSRQGRSFEMTRGVQPLSPFPATGKGGAGELTLRVRRA